MKVKKSPKKSERNSSDVLTREVLREELGSFRKEVQQEFKAVREEVGGLRNEMRQEFRDVRAEMDKRFPEVDDNAQIYRDEVLTKVVDFAGKYETVQEEKTIAEYQVHDVRVQVKDHEKRILRLEKSHKTS